MKKSIYAFALSIVLLISSLGVGAGPVLAQDYIYSDYGSPEEVETIKVKPGWNSYLKNGKKYWYYGDSRGNLVSGWKKIGGKWYAFAYGKDVYLDFCGRYSGLPAYSKCQMLAGTTMALYDRKRQSESQSKVYSFKNNGAMITGWYKGDSLEILSNGRRSNKKVWYYHLPSGKAAEGWKPIGGKWYYFSVGKVVNPVKGSPLKYYSGGVMQTGWQKISGKRYYLGGNGAMRTGWQSISGKWYYFKSDGAMVTGKQKIKGKTYTFNSNGVWVK